MASDIDARVISEYWGREKLAEAMLDALKARGADLDALTPDEVAPVDQFHGGGKPVTVRLAKVAGAAPGMRVLDVGGGFGGPARTLAVEFGCHVTTVDLTESYVRAAKMLTARGHSVPWRRTVGAGLHRCGASRSTRVAERTKFSEGAWI